MTVAALRRTMRPGCGRRQRPCAGQRLAGRHPAGQDHRRRYGRSAGPGGHHDHPFSCSRVRRGPGSCMPIRTRVTSGCWPTGGWACSTSALSTGCRTASRPSGAGQPDRDRAGQRRPGRRTAHPGGRGVRGAAPACPRSRCQRALGRRGRGQSRAAALTGAPSEPVSIWASRRWPRSLNGHHQRLGPPRPVFGLLGSAARL